jgi:hypothetical protein
MYANLTFEKFNLMGGNRACTRTHAGADQCTGASTHACRPADNRATAGPDRTAGEGAATHGVPATREAKQKNRSCCGHCEFAFHGICS